MTFAVSRRRHGSDKPDLRNPMELTDVADLLETLLSLQYLQVRRTIRKVALPLCVFRVAHR